MNLRNILENGSGTEILNDSLNYVFVTGKYRRVVDVTVSNNHLLTSVKIQSKHEFHEWKRERITRW